MKVISLLLLVCAYGKSLNSSIASYQPQAEGASTYICVHVHLFGNMFGSSKTYRIYRSDDGIGMILVHEDVAWRADHRQ